MSTNKKRSNPIATATTPPTKKQNNNNNNKHLKEPELEEEKPSSTITTTSTLSATIPPTISNYIGPKGYTLLKSNLTPKEETAIKKELTIKPFSMPVGGGGGGGKSPAMMFGSANQVSYPVYRESAKKLYVPQYYGKEKFGNTVEVKIPPGLDIHLEFNGALRDYQEPVIQKAITYFHSQPSTAGLLELPCAWGKTGGSLYLVSALSKKTLVIVHKEFLMNQWIERIAQFLPAARVGKIQGQVIDIEDKDIVLCMLQSLSMKEYPANMFDSFGFTIIDEVHHISSQTFSCALFKIVTRYMLGLSATLNRKDGTTNVIKMFLGNVIYKGKREEQHNVCVKGYHYRVHDDEFNEMKYDSRGNPMYSSMITKLCDYNRRSEYILSILAATYAANPAQQIMILAHNKSLLEYFYQAISRRGICGGDVGYYVGGMKEAALKESEGRKVIIATYSMAAEALDIKTLTTLIMATPKTDIEQAVGRILRDKHASPLVIDIIDGHQIFLNQWRKRKAFYKKNKYTITEHTQVGAEVDKLEEDEEEMDAIGGGGGGGSGSGVCFL
jgi:superfamily II DNA or RNA helicase